MDEAHAGPAPPAPWAGAATGTGPATPATPVSPSAPMVAAGPSTSDATTAVTATSEETAPGGSDTQQQRRGPSGVVRLRGLPFSAGAESIRDLFHNFELEEVFVCTRNGRNTGEAYVRLADKALMAVVLETLDKSYLGTRYIEMFAANDADISTAKALAADKGKGHVLRLRGLPYAATASDVIQFFSGVEIPRGAQGVVLVYTPDGKPTGEAFVDFKDDAAVAAAMDRNRQLMGSRYIELFHSTKADLLTAMQNNSRHLAMVLGSYRTLSALSQQAPAPAPVAMVQGGWPTAVGYAPVPQLYMPEAHAAQQVHQLATAWQPDPSAVASSSGIQTAQVPRPASGQVATGAAAAPITAVVAAAANVLSSRRQTPSSMPGAGAMFVPGVGWSRGGAGALEATEQLSPAATLAGGYQTGTSSQLQQAAQMQGASNYQMLVGGQGSRQALQTAQLAALQHARGRSPNRLRSRVPSAHTAQLASTSAPQFGQYGRTQTFGTVFPEMGMPFIMQSASAGSMQQQPVHYASASGAEQEMSAGLPPGMQMQGGWVGTQGATWQAAGGAMLQYAPSQDPLALGMMTPGMAPGYMAAYAGQAGQMGPGAYTQAYFQGGAGGGQFSQQQGSGHQNY